jgi:hypothetical protein
MAARGAGLGHLDLATHPGAGMLDRLTRSGVLRLSRLEEVKDVLCARCRPESERWFGEITTKRIRRGSFGSVSELVQAIESYIAHNNEDPPRSSGPKRPSRSSPKFEEDVWPVRPSSKRALFECHRTRQRSG